MFRLTNYPLITFVVTFILMWLGNWAGMYLRKHWRADPEQVRDDFGVILGATLTLLGLIIGFTFSMATTRYDLRKSLEEEEANAIGTEYVRVDLLPSGCGRQGPGASGPLHRSPHSVLQNEQPR